MKGVADGVVPARKDTPGRHLADAASFTQMAERALARAGDRVDARDRAVIDEATRLATQLRRRAAQLERALAATRRPR